MSPSHFVLIAETLCLRSGSATNGEEDFPLPFSRTPTSKLEPFALEQEVGGQLPVAGCDCLDVALPLGVDCRNNLLTEWECD
jgi:hypothetical protein